MPIDSQTLEQLRDLLVTRAGGYLRNPIIERDVTCVVCQTPCIGYRWCVRCNAQSAVLAVRAAGAAYASVLNVARWIEPAWQIPEYDNNAGFLAQRCARDYDPMICPWTGASCS